MRHSNGMTDVLEAETKADSGSPEIRPSGVQDPAPCGGASVDGAFLVAHVKRMTNVDWLGSIGRSITGCAPGDHIRPSKSVLSTILCIGGTEGTVFGVGAAILCPM
jgi:hypothetical protein